MATNNSKRRRIARPSWPATRLLGKCVLLLLVAMLATFAIGACGGSSSDNDIQAEAAAVAEVASAPAEIATTAAEVEAAVAEVAPEEAAPEEAAPVEAAEIELAPVEATEVPATATSEPATATPVPTNTREPTRTPTPAATAVPAFINGVPTILEIDLPPEAWDTLQLIDDNGPFPFDRDGITFQNREGLLPSESRNYYSEYTVITPGESTRGARRIIEGADGELYYTDDHYESFFYIVR